MSFSRQNLSSTSSNYTTYVSPAAGIGAPTLIKAGKVSVLGFRAANPNASIVYVQLFDAATAGAVTLGTTVPVDTFFLASSGVADRNRDYSVSFNNGLVVACTTAHVGGTAVTTAVPLVIDYA